MFVIVSDVNLDKPQVRQAFIFVDGEPQYCQQSSIMLHWGGERCRPLDHILACWSGAVCPVFATSSRFFYVSCDSGAKLYGIHVYNASFVPCHRTTGMYVAFIASPSSRDGCVAYVSRVSRAVYPMSHPVSGDGKAGGLVRGVPVRAAPSALRSHGKLLLLAHHTRYVRMYQTCTLFRPQNKISDM